MATTFVLIYRLLRFSAHFLALASTSAHYLCRLLGLAPSKKPLTVSAKACTPYFADSSNDDWANSKRLLFIRSDWTPQPALIPIEFGSRVPHFLKHLKNMFKGRRVHTMLSPFQQKLLAFDDHLNNEKKLQPTSPSAANDRITDITKQIQQSEAFKLPKKTRGHASSTRSKHRTSSSAQSLTVPATSLDADGSTTA
jgi:hypothetical protein